MCDQLCVCVCVFSQIVDEVGIVEMRTLEGLINKIFDKALNDTHFCELYANMVRSLSDNPKCPKVGSAAVSTALQVTLSCDACATQRGIAK